MFARPRWAGSASPMPSPPVTRRASANSPVSAWRAGSRASRRSRASTTASRSYRGKGRSHMLQADPADFSPPLLRIQQKPPPPLAGWMLRLLIALLAGLLLWAIFGRLDIVAVADGKLVPSSYLKIVQPSEQGIVKEILVKEGERVEEGRVLIRMDAALTEADVKSIQAEYDNKRLALRRIDAQLAGKPPSRERGDPPELFAQVSAQHLA